MKIQNDELKLQNAIETNSDKIFKMSMKNSAYINDHVDVTSKDIVSTVGLPQTMDSQSSTTPSNSNLFNLSISRM